MRENGYQENHCKMSSETLVMQCNCDEGDFCNFSAKSFFENSLNGGSWKSD